jgi:fructokinase
MSDVALVVGEALVDMVDRGGQVTEYPGGSPANVAVALARLDRRVRFASAYADDRLGRTLADHLGKAGIQPAGDPAAVDHTSSAQVTIGPDGSASYVFDIDWRLNSLDLAGDRPLVVHTSSIAAVLAPGCDAVAAILESQREHALVSYDVNARPSITGAGPDVVAAVERIVALADVVKASDEDLTTLYPDRSIEDSMAALLAAGPRMVVLTRGGDGASWLSRTGSGMVESVPAVVADTIGAGDTFSAGMIDALWSRDLLGAGSREALVELPVEVWREVLLHAARAAAITVSRPGADPPYRHELPG